METLGRKRVIEVLPDNEFIVEVKDCRSIDDDGSLLWEAKLAYFKVYGESKQDAITNVRYGSGDYQGNRYP